MVLSVLSRNVETRRHSLASGSTYGNVEGAGIGLRKIGCLARSSGGIYRSRELREPAADLSSLLLDLGVETIFDLRNIWEVERMPAPHIPRMKILFPAPKESKVGKDTESRLRAGVIGEYGKPGERMIELYRRFGEKNGFVVSTVKAIASDGRPSLVHCRNGKDRCGVVSATLLRIAGFCKDSIMEDYLLTNKLNSDINYSDYSRLGVGMNPYELAILRSFLMARPDYLQSYFRAIDESYGSFESYVKTGICLDNKGIGVIRGLLDPVQ